MSIDSHMLVRDAMSGDVLTVEPGEALREAARRMAERQVGAAVVADAACAWPGIVTERDVLHAIAEGKELDRVDDHQTRRVVFASAEWPLHRAARTMVDGRFRHLVVVEGRRAVGVLSMRDVVRCWARESAATRDLPAAAAAS